MSYYVNRAGHAQIDKTPGERLDYGRDMSDEMAKYKDKILSATCLVHPGLAAVNAPFFDDNAVGQMIEGGTLNAVYPIIFTILTVGGRIYTRTIYIKIVATKS